MQLSDELRNQLMESAAWGKAGITPTERVDESAEVVEEKAEEVEAEVVEKETEAEETVTEAEVHVCPLCVSELSEAIDEERILEHLDVVVGLVDRLSQLDEGDENIEAIIDETIAELLLQNQETEDEE